MFGIMDRETGKCWPSQGLWYKEQLDQFNFSAKNHSHIAVPLDYVNTRIIRIQKDTYEVK